MKKLGLIIPLCLIPHFLFAEYGCLVPDHPELLIYQTNPPGGTFSNSPFIAPGPGCYWVLDRSMPSTGCIGHGRGGDKGTYTQDCPIDDYIPALFIFTAGFVFLRFRNRSISIS